MSSDEEDATLLTPHRVVIRERELIAGTTEMEKRISALRQQVAKFDAIEYRKAQLASDHKTIKEFREEFKEEEAILKEREEIVKKQNVELAGAIKDHKKEALFNSRKTLKENRTKRSTFVREESSKNEEFLEIFEEDDKDYRQSLRNAIKTADKEHIESRAKFFEKRSKEVKKQQDSFVSSKKAVCDGMMENAAALILKEARIIRQLLLLREKNANMKEKKSEEAAGQTDEDGGKEEGSANSKTKKSS